MKDKILIIGGYGAVGKVVSECLAKEFPGKVIIAGRDKRKATAFILKQGLSAIPAVFDLSSNSFHDINLEQVHTSISCIEYLQNDKKVKFPASHWLVGRVKTSACVCCYINMYCISPLNHIHCKRK